jgi:hypothetical protein
MNATWAEPWGNPFFGGGPVDLRLVARGGGIEVRVVQPLEPLLQSGLLSETPMTTTHDIPNLRRLRAAVLARIV